MNIPEEYNIPDFQQEGRDRLVNLPTVKSESKKTHFQLANGLLLFYMAVAGNFLGELFSKRMQRLLSENRLVKHMIGFITMLFSITYVAGFTELKPALLITFIMYTWFVLSTKMFEWYNIVIIILLALGFMIEKSRDNLDSDDPEDQKTMDKLTKLNNFFLVLTLVVTVVGLVSYYRYQKSQYGADFSLYKFLIN